MCIALLTFVGFIAARRVLSSRVEDRKKEVRGRSSDTLDLLTISVEAGLSLNAAMAQVVKNVPGVLSSEFARMLQEIQLGVPRSEAFRHLAERTDVEELNAFALAMIQADIFGCRSRACFGRRRRSCGSSGVRRSRPRRSRRR